MNIPEGYETGSNITAELVERVSQRRAFGMPLKTALAGEGVACEDYEEHLREHPDLAELEDVAKRELLEHALSVLLNGKDATANYRWLIERVYKNVIGSEREEEPEEVKLVAGVPEEELEEARRYARRL